MLSTRLYTVSRSTASKPARWSPAMISCLVILTSLLDSTDSFRWVGIWRPNLESCSDRCKRYFGLKTERIEYPQQKVTGHAGSVAIEYCGHFCPRSSRKFCGLVVREVLSLDDVFDLVSNFCSEFDLNSVLRRQIKNVAKLENVVCDINLCFAPLYRFNISHNLFFAVSISFCGVVCVFFAKA